MSVWKSESETVAFVQMENCFTSAAILFSAVTLKSLISYPLAISFCNLQEFGLIFAPRCILHTMISFSSVPHKSPLKLFPGQESDLFPGL